MDNSIKNGGIFENESQLTAESVLILYILELLAAPVTDSVLTEVLLGPGLVNYFSAHSRLTALIEAGYAVRVLDSMGTVMYDITDSGRAALDSLKYMLSGGLGAAYAGYIKNHRDDLDKNLRIDGVCSEDRRGNLIVHCFVRDGLQCYFEITLPVADKKDAALAIERWRRDPAGIYAGMLRMLTEKEDERS